MLSILTSENRSYYSLSEAYDYTDWQTAGATGEIDLFCPDSSVVVGYERRTGAWLDRFRLVCKHLNEDGTLGEISYTEFNSNSDGGTNFAPFILEGNQALVKIGANVSTWYTNY